MWCGVGNKTGRKVRADTQKSYTAGKILQGFQNVKHVATPQLTPNAQLPLTPDASLISVFIILQYITAEN